MGDLISKPDNTENCYSYDTNIPSLNVCNSMGDKFEIPDICGDPTMCATLGYGNEWISDKEIKDKDKCCGGGKRQICERHTFSGNPSRCCTQNYTGTGTNSDCFSDAANSKTCAPKYRSITGSGCRKMFSSVCVDPATSSNDMYDIWNTNPYCSSIILANSQFVNGAYNQEALTWAQSAMSQTFAKFLTFTGGVIQPPGVDTRMQKYLYTFCYDNTQACTSALRETCNQYSIDTVSTNGNAVKFCGCYMGDIQYSRYTNLYGISKECTPICARNDTIGLMTDKGSVQPCRGSVCIIDNVSIYLNNTTTGPINFNQACGGCTGSSTCYCAITDINITTAEAQLGGIDLTQQCTGTLDCYRENPNDPNAPAVKVDCNAPSNYVPTQEEINNSQGVAPPVVVIGGLNRSLYLIVGLFAALAGILLIFVVVAANYGGKPGIQRTTQNQVRFNV